LAVNMNLFWASIAVGILGSVSMTEAIWLWIQ
jgi:hypothetical protein